MFSKKSFIAASIGSLLEYYDFSLFSIFLPILSPIFFHSSNHFNSLMKGYYILLLSIIFRPLGALFFGSIGDFKGRKKAIFFSIYGMSLATIIIGIIPDYNTIGVAAIVILVCAKMTQVFCFAGEFNGASVYILEHSSNINRQGLISGLLCAMTLFGSVLASISGILTALKSSPEWGWRIAFIIGGIIGLIGGFFRQSLLETPEFIPANKNLHSNINLFRNFKKELLFVFFAGGFITIPFTTVLTVISSILLINNVISKFQFMILQTYLSLMAMFFLIISGYLADKFSPKKIVLIGSFLFTILIYPLLKVVDSGQLPLIIISLTVLILLNEMCFAPSNVILKKIFPVEFRYRGISIAFNLGMAIIGGLTPILESLLYKVDKKFTLIFIWPGFISLCLFFCLLNIQENIIKDR